MSIFDNDNSAYPLTTDSEAEFLYVKFLPIYDSDYLIADYIQYGLIDTPYALLSVGEEITIVSHYKYHSVCFFYNVRGVELNATRECSYPLYQGGRPRRQTAAQEAEIDMEYLRNMLGIQICSGDRDGDITSNEVVPSSPCQSCQLYFKQSNHEVVTELCGAGMTLNPPSCSSYEEGTPNIQDSYLNEEVTASITRVERNVVTTPTYHLDGTVDSPTTMDEFRNTIRAIFDDGWHRSPNYAFHESRYEFCAQVWAHPTNAQTLHLAFSSESWGLVMTNGEDVLVRVCSTLDQLLYLVRNFEAISTFESVGLLSSESYSLDSFREKAKHLFMVRPTDLISYSTEGDEWVVTIRPLNTTRTILLS